MADYDCYSLVRSLNFVAIRPDGSWSLCAFIISTVLGE